MDLRSQRTKKCIINAFIELRKKKPIEKITIKELSDYALVHKTTFYNHYQDIYDLSDQLESEVIEIIVNKIENFDNIIKYPKQVTENLANAVQSQEKLIKIIFSGSRQGVFIQKLSAKLKEQIYKYFPQYKSNLEFDVVLSILILGSFYTASNYSHENYNKIVDILSDVSETLMMEFR